MSTLELTPRQVGQACPSPRALTGLHRFSRVGRFTAFSELHACLADFGASYTAPPSIR